jgi:hypothetical protein
MSRKDTPAFPPRPDRAEIAGPADPGTLDPWPLRLLAAFGVLHVLLWLSVPDAHQAMLVGDRAGNRLEVLRAAAAAPLLDEVLAVVYRSGAPGDWILFLPAFAAGGQDGILIQSLVLYALALVLLYRLGAMFLARRLAALAAGAWMLLPATPFHPHALVSEAVCNPLLIALALVLARIATAPAERRQAVLLAGMLSGLLAFTRHIYLLSPIAIVLWVVALHPAGFGQGA